MPQAPQMVHDRVMKRNRARTILSRAVAKGILVRPKICSKCGGTAAPDHVIEAHHQDYEKPLEVEWMCFRCHTERDHSTLSENGKTGSTFNPPGS